MLGRLAISLLSFLAVGFASGQQASACWCWVGLPTLVVNCHLDTWTDVPGSVVEVTTLNHLGTATNQTPACTVANANPPNRICDVDGNAQDVTMTSRTGGIAIDKFGITATQQAQEGTTQTITAACGSPTTLTNWCECCEARADIRWKTITKQQNCGCDYYRCSLVPPFCVPMVYSGTCSETVSGSVTVFDGVICSAPTCVPPSPCDPNCPS